MKPAERIEKLIKERRYKASAETYYKALGSFLQTVDEHIKQKSAQTRPEIWRKIVNSRITKLAAAAVIIIAGILVIYQTNGSIDIANVSFGQITENMKKMPWMHAVIEGAGESMECWACFERKFVINKRSNGEAIHHDFLKMIVHEYDPDANTVTVSSGPLPGGNMLGNSAMDFPKMILKLFEDANDNAIQETTGKYKEKDAKIFKMSTFLGGMDMKVEMFVDAEKDILLFLNQKAFDKTGKLVMEATGHFDYPEKGPESIYDVGVPKSAKIIDNLLSKEVSEILELYRSHRESAPSIYIAVVQETRFHPKDNTPTWHGVSIVYKNGIKQRVNGFRIPTSQRNMGWSEYLIIIGWEMGNTFDSQLLWWEKNGLLSSIQLYDGKYQYDANKRNDKWIRQPKQYSYGGDLRADNDLADLGWGVHFISPYQGCGPFTIIEDNYSLENGLICMETKAQGWISDKGWAVLPTRIVTYLNPQRDYICQRYENHAVFDAPWQKDKSWLEKFNKDKISTELIEVREVTKFAQTVDGKWYPTVIEHHSQFRKYGESSGDTNARTEKIYLETNPQFPEDIFDPEALAALESDYPETDKSPYDEAFREAISIVDSRENWPEPRELVISYWQHRNAKNYGEMAILWPSSAPWNRQVIEKEEPVKYVFGEVQPWEIEGHVIVPYASKSYYNKHGKYSLKMVLSNKKSAKGRYYIVSGN